MVSANNRKEGLTMALDERKRKVLRAIIDDYINTAEPVGSRAIVRRYELGVSPATIRNEMADLEMLGYLEQPHTSAGRIPSGKGYRFYVDCLMDPQGLNSHEIALIQQWYESRVKDVNAVFQETAKLLSRVTRNVSLVLAPQITQCAFKYLQFLPFDERKVLAVIVTDTGFVENKLIEIPSGIDMEDLQRIADLINSQLSGLRVEQIQPDLLLDIQQQVIQHPGLFESTTDLLRRSLTVQRGEKVYLGGATQLLNQPEFKDVEKFRNILTMLEEEQLLCDILAPISSEAVTVTIGAENKFSGIQQCSMVTATYRVNGQTIGTIAVLGPTRMEYAKMVGVMQFMTIQMVDELKKFGL
jgi:heat-inducible transcriptional repressor